MQRIDRYLLRVFLAHWLVIGAGLLGLISVLDFIGHLDEVGESSAVYGPIGGEVLLYYAVNLLFLLVQFAPYITLLAGVASVLHLQRGREWTPILTAGRATLRAFLPLYAGAALAALAVLLVRESALPELVSRREALQRRVFHQRPWELADLWARASDDTRLRAGRFVPGEGQGGREGPPRLEDVEVFEVLPDGTDRLLHAESASWNGGAWELVGGARVVTGREEDEVDRFVHPDLEPDDLLLAYFGQVSPLDLSSAGFGELLERDPEHRQAATLLWSWRAAPWAHLLLLALGLPFVMRFDRRSSLEGVALGIFLGMLYFVAEFLFRDLGGRGVLSPWLAGIGPLLVFGSVGLWATARLPT